MSEQIAYVRNNSVAISYESRTGLNFVSQAKGLNNPDALAESVIIAWLADNHPDVLAHIRQRQKQDDDFRNELKAKLNPDPFRPKS